MGDHLAPDTHSLLIMPVSTFPILIAVLVALSTMLACFALVTALGARRGRGTRSPRPKPGARLLREVLRQIPIPEGIRRSWAGSATAERLRLAGVSIDAQEYAALRWGLLWAGLLTALGVLLARSDLVASTLAVLGALGAYLGPEAWISHRTERRGEEVDNALPNLLDRLALGLEAGLGFEIALRRVAANYPGLLGDELRRTLRRLDHGHRRADALQALLRRLPSQDLPAFVTAVRQSDRLGTSLAQTLRVQTRLLRARRRRRAEEASRRLPVVIVFPLVFFFLPALLIIYLAPPLLHVFLAR